MRKNVWKYWVDALLFVDMCSIAVIGLLMAFVIPSGGQRHSDEKYFLGLHRHEWGDIHLYLSLLLLGLLVLHLWFNWTWIVQSTKSYFGDYWKNFLGMLCGAWLVVLFAAWIIAKF